MVDAKTIAVSRKLGGGGGGGGSDLARQVIDRTVTEVSDDTIETIGNYAFAYCSYLQSLKSKSVKNIGDFGANTCTALKELYLPSLTTIGKNAFSTCHALESICLPSVTKINDSAFASCTNLVSADFSSRVTMTATVFNNDTKFKILILRANTCSVLSKITVFGGTCFASGKSGGILLVPAALIETYKNTTNWSTIYGYGTNQFLALEDYTVDGTTTGAIDWDKVNAL